MTLCVLSWALLEAQATGIMIARVTIHRKVNKKPNSIQKETFETQCSF